MAYLVLLAGLIQAAVGVSLLVGWLRHGRRRPAVVVGHVAVVTVSLALWIAFSATGLVALAWTAFAVLTVGLTIGDMLLAARARRGVASKTTWADYGSSIAAVFRGRMPRRVTFHALFSPVVYFPMLAVCIGATIAG